MDTNKKFKLAYMCNSRGTLNWVTGDPCGTMLWTERHAVRIPNDMEKPSLTTLAETQQHRKWFTWSDLSCVCVCSHYLSLNSYFLLSPVLYPANFSTKTTSSIIRKLFFKCSFGSGEDAVLYKKKVDRNICFLH